jgi:hypothetical protein
MEADIVARRGTSTDSVSNIDPVFQRPKPTAWAELRPPTPHRIDPAEIVALLSERRNLPKMLVDTLDELREEVGDFVVKNMHTPQVHYGFNSKPVPPVDVSQLEQLVWQAHEKLESVYRSFEPTRAPALAFRSIIIDVRSQLKGFLLDMKTRQIDEGLNAIEKPAFLAGCITLENYLGQTVQRVEGVRIEVGQGESED